MFAAQGHRATTRYRRRALGLRYVEGGGGGAGRRMTPLMSSRQYLEDGGMNVAADAAIGGDVGNLESLELSEMDTECAKRVFVCTNRWCMEKGSSATLGSFVGLAPQGEVSVQGVNCLGRCSKGPNLRVRQADGEWLEFNRIDSVERVYKVLRDYLGAPVSKKAALCFKYNFLANGALDRNEVATAIDYYDKAIATGYADQQGVLLVMRATAFMQRAYSHGRELADMMQKVMVDVPTQGTLNLLDELWKASDPRSKVVLLDMFSRFCEGRGNLYRTTKFRFGLFEFALLRACEDALRATESLPNHPKCWLTAGDALTALRKPKEAAGYYQVALDLDASMESYLKPKIEALNEGYEGDALAALAGF
ncbi:unnamed protein product [Ascophyllum nodosum]